MSLSQTTRCFGSIRGPSDCPSLFTYDKLPQYAHKCKSRPGYAAIPGVQG